MYYADIGTISHATLRPDDLLDAFAETLDALAESRALSDDSRDTVELVGWTHDVLAHVEREREGGDAPGDWELVGMLEEALSAYAAPGTYFGAHEADGSDFGFWPDWDYLDSISHVSDPCELDTMGGYECAHVNDHGNVTMYVRDGDEWREVWAVV
jgi:hypothetical protein